MNSFTVTPEHRHLTTASIMRIEVGLSSRKSSVVVFNTISRLVAVGGGEWESIAVGAPCILLVKETTAPDSPFQVRLAVVDVKSGISLWEEELDSSAGYTELRPGFHTFTFGRQCLALQFADAAEAASLMDSLNQYIAQKVNVDAMLEEKRKKKEEKRKSKKKDQRRVSKLDISLPCEFRHLSGLTAGNSEESQQELEGTAMRRQRSASMSAISQKKAKQRGRIPSEMTDGELYSKSDKSVASKSSETPEKVVSPPPTKERRRGIFKSHSMRITKQKPIIEKIKPSDDFSVPSATSISSSNCNSEDHPYWSIPDIQQSTTKHRNQYTHQTPTRSSIPQTSVNVRNSMPPMQNAWRSNADEDNASRSSSRSTPRHSATSSPVPVAQMQPAIPHLEKKPTWPDGIMQFISSPAHIRLNTSPEHHFPMTVSTPTSSVSSPLHTSSSSSITSKYRHIKPTFNTYDTLLPLDPKEKLTPLTPISSNIQHKSAQKKPIAKPSPIPITNNSVVAPSPITSPGSLDPKEKLTPLSPISSNIQHKSIQKKPIAKPSPIPIKDNSVVTPPPIISPGDLDGLGAELSRMLKDFDSLIAPQSPLESAFNYSKTTNSETMV